MSDVVDTNLIAVDPAVSPVSITEDDFDSLQEIQVLVDSLSKYRQEMGRLVQLIGNLREEANKTEINLAEKRKSLAAKYKLETLGKGQWALDFERKEFVKTSQSTPVIP